MPTLAPLAGLPGLPGLPDLTAVAVAYPLESRVCIAVTGPDAASWLNGLLTCDVLGAMKHALPLAVYGCALNVKGKMLADAIVVATTGGLSVYLPRDAAPAIVGLWQGYIVMEECEIAVDPTRVAVLVQGATAAAVVERSGISAASFDDLGVGGLALQATRDTLAATLDALVAAGASPIDEARANDLRIDAGRATYGVDVNATHYVQEAGLEGRAVSFSKGCYLGQEVVCMLQMRGKVHRKLARLRFDDGTANVAVGGDVTIDDAVVGKVTSAHFDGARTHALALLKAVAIAEGKTVASGGARGVIVGEAG